MYGNRAALLFRQGNHSLCGFLYTGSLQGGDLDHLAAQLLAQLLNVDLIAVLFHHIHHVHGHQNRDAQLHQLGGQVKVTLDIRSVHDIQDRVRPFRNQVVSGHNLFQRVGRQGINSRKVHDYNIPAALQLTFLLLHRYARPVSHKLIGTGQRIEQCCFSAVWISCQCNLN